MLTLNRSADVDLNGAASILIKVPVGADRPAAIMVKLNGEQKVIDLQPGHNRVLHTRTGFSALINTGYCDLQYQTPAPQAPGTPKFHDDI